MYVLFFQKRGGAICKVFQIYENFSMLPFLFLPPFPPLLPLLQSLRLPLLVITHHCPSPCFSESFFSKSSFFCISLCLKEAKSLLYLPKLYSRLIHSRLTLEASLVISRNFPKLEPIFASKALHQAMKPLDLFIRQRYSLCYAPFTH